MNCLNQLMTYLTGFVAPVNRLMHITALKNPSGIDSHNGKTTTATKTISNDNSLKIDELVSSIRNIISVNTTPRAYITTAAVNSLLTLPIQEYQQTATHTGATQLFPAPTQFQSDSVLHTSVATLELVPDSQNNFILSSSLHTEEIATQTSTSVSYESQSAGISNKTITLVSIFSAITLILTITVVLFFRSKRLAKLKENSYCGIKQDTSIVSTSVGTVFGGSSLFSKDFQSYQQGK